MAAECRAASMAEQVASGGKHRVSWVWYFLYIFYFRLPSKFILHS